MCPHHDLVSHSSTHPSQIDRITPISDGACFGEGQALSDPTLAFCDSGLMVPVPVALVALKPREHNRAPAHANDAHHVAEHVSRPHF